MPSAAQRIARLRETIRRYDDAYYVRDQPEVSDEKYDRLFDELRRLEQQNPDLMTPDSPTQRVAGEPVAAFGTVRHLAPMLSLDAVTTVEAVRQFDRRMRAGRDEPPSYVVEPKFDGLSLELVYENGRFRRASTRGDGQRGEDVTRNVRTIRAVPLELHAAALRRPAVLAVRAEAFMRIADFEKLNAALERGGKPLFANPRNAAAGSIRQLDARITARRPLDLVVYEILAMNGGPKLEKHWDALSQLGEWGLRVAPAAERAKTIDDVLVYHRDMEGRRDRLGYEIDGVVVKLDDLPARERLGVTGRHPRWALAFKFTARAKETTIEDMIVQVGRTGVLTPVARLSPVQIGGVTVTRATLHNREEIARKDVRIGDTVRVVRAGDVIPEVVERVGRHTARSRAFAMPKQCPVCGAAIRREGPADLCPNAFACPAQLKGAIAHFGSRDALDIRGLGRETVDRLVSTGLVKDVSDLFALRERDLTALDRFADVSAANLVRAIEHAKHTDVSRFLHGLGIPGVGLRTARLLADHFGRLDRIQSAGAADVQAAGVGPVVAGHVVEFFRTPAVRRLIARCLQRGVRIAGEARAGRVRAARRGPLAGKTVVFTGALDSMSRRDAEDLVRNQGGRAAGSVSRATDFVVSGAEAGSKLDQARVLGVRVIDEREFLRLARRT